MKKIKTAQWTVMIYMDAEPEGFDKSLEESIKEFNFSGSNDEVNIIVLVDRKKPKKTEEGKPVYAFPSIYRILKNEPITIHTRPLHVIKNETLGNPEVLEKFLTYCKEKFPAEKYMLSFWDHGTGTGVEGGTEQMKKELENVFLFAQEHSLTGEIPDLTRLFEAQFIKQKKTRRVFNTLVNLHTPGTKRDNKRKAIVEEDFLYLTEIKTAITNAFGKDVLLDIVAFDACWIQMFENAYTLKDCAKYMVASENLISADGMGYKFFFSNLIEYPALSASEAARLLINTSFLKVGEEDKFTMCSLNLQKVDLVNNKIDELSDLFIPNLKKLSNTIRNARFLCLSFFDEGDPSGFDLKVVDLIYFLKKLILNLVNLTKNAIINNDKKILDEEPLYNKIITVCEEIITIASLKMIEYRQIGSAMSEEKESDKRWGAHGFSIFFPEHAFEWEEYKELEGFYFPVNNVPALPFAVKNKWAIFLKKYFALR